MGAWQYGLEPPILGTPFLVATVPFHCHYTSIKYSIISLNDLLYPTIHLCLRFWYSRTHSFEPSFMFKSSDNPLLAYGTTSTLFKVSVLFDTFLLVRMPYNPPALVQMRHIMAGMWNTVPVPCLRHVCRRIAFSISNSIQFNVNMNLHIRNSNQKARLRSLSDQDKWTDCENLGCMSQDWGQSKFDQFCKSEALLVSISNLILQQITWCARIGSVIQNAT